MLRKLLKFGIIFDGLGTLALAVWSVYALYVGQTLEAIYFILGSIWLGRGQVVRATAREIRAEFEAIDPRKDEE